MPYTLTDVANSANVSIATASRVLADSDYPVAEGTRRRVLEAARKLGYQPNLIARSLRTDRTLTIGLIVENILSPFIPPLVRSIHDYLTQHNYLSIIVNSDWDLETEAKAIQDLSRRQIDGIIFVESRLSSSDHVPELDGIPHVFVHRLFNGLAPNSVVPDDLYGARLATRHLAELGHQRIAFINGPAGWDAATNRMTGYRQELEAWGFAFDPARVRTGDWEVQSGYLATQSLIELDPLPTALFAANDLMALGAIYAIQKAGLRVPDDVAIVGYDDRDFAGFVRPAITTVRMPCEEMGRVSAESLVHMLGGESKPLEPILIRGNLVVRQSCGAGEGEWEFEPERGGITRGRLLKQPLGNKQQDPR